STGLDERRSAELRVWPIGRIERQGAGAKQVQVFAVRNVQSARAHVADVNRHSPDLLAERQVPLIGLLNGEISADPADGLDPGKRGVGLEWTRELNKRSVGIHDVERLVGLP